MDYFGTGVHCGDQTREVSVGGFCAGRIHCPLSCLGTHGTCSLAVVVSHAMAQPCLLLSPGCDTCSLPQDSSLHGHVTLSSVPGLFHSHDVVQVIHVVTGHCLCTVSVRLCVCVPFSPMDSLGDFSPVHSARTPHSSTAQAPFHMLPSSGRHSLFSLAPATCLAVLHVTPTSCHARDSVFPKALLTPVCFSPFPEVAPLSPIF